MSEIIKSEIELLSESTPSSKSNSAFLLKSNKQLLEDYNLDNNNSNNEQNNISLGEILAKFSLIRPLYINESSALCYQLLNLLENNLIYENSHTIKVFNLNYPTLSNIKINKHGFVYLNKINQSYTISDWLIALSETLYKHTLWNQSAESRTFKALTVSLKLNHHATSSSISNNSNKFIDLKEHLELWKKTCLYLCSLDENSYKILDQPLKQLQIRGNQAYTFQLFNNELNEKNILMNKSDSKLFNKSQTNMIKLENKTNSSNSNKIKNNEINLTEKEAFTKWVGKWKFVNTEFLAKKFIKTEMNNSKTLLNHQYCHYSNIDDDNKNLIIHNKLMKRSNPELDRDFQLDKLTQELNSKTNNFDNSNKETNTNYEIYLNILKTMYSNFISKPLCKLQQSLKDVTEQFRVQNKSQPETVSNTLNQLEQVLMKATNN